MDVLAQINELLTPYLENGKFFVVNMSLSSSKRNPTLVLLVDSDEGITIDECGIISRQLGNDIEAKELFDIPFVLEVSSPGVDFPLTTTRQFSKNIGRMLKITLLDGTKMLGKLSEVNEESISMFEETLKGKIKSIKKEATSVALLQIKNAVAQVSFSEI
jgi:ribosome maturation factor RimP